MSEAGAASRFAWGVADLVPLRAKRRTVRLAAGAAAEFACHSKACAPPPVGSGGSKGAGSGGAKPWERPFKPGHWERGALNLEEEVDRFYERMREGGNADAAALMSREQVASVLSSGAFAQASRVVTMYNGPLSVSYDPSEGEIPPAQLKRIMDTLDALHQRFPAPSKEVAISLDGEIQGDPGIWGSFWPNLSSAAVSRVSLKSSVQARDALISESTSPGFFQTSNPTGLRSGQWTLVHEWGHTLDREAESVAGQATFDVARRTGGLSRYGSKSAPEAFAESFADWVTSGGQSTNPATLVYAKEHRWPVP